MNRTRVNIILILSAIILTCSAVLFTFLLTYEKEIHKIVNKEVGKYISSHYQIGDIKINPFRHFPRVSVVVANFSVSEHPDFGNNCLLKTKGLYLQMSIFSLLKKTYIIDRIELKDTRINLFTNEDGKSNYNVFKKGKNTSDNYSIDLQKITLDHVKIIYQNKKQNLTLNCEMKKSYFKGSFQNEKYDLLAKTDVYIDSLNYLNVKALSNNHLELETTLKIDNSVGKYLIENFTARLDAILLDIKGNIENIKSENKIDLHISSKGMTFNDILPLLPDSVYNPENIKLSGQCNFIADIKGKITNETFPDISLNYSVADASAMFIKEGVLFDKIEFSGNLSNKVISDSLSGTFNIDKLKMLCNGKELNMQLALKNFKSPYIDLNLQSDVSPKALSLISGQKMFLDVEGDMSINISFKGFYHKLLNGDIKDSNLIFSSDFRGLNFKFKNYKIKDLIGNLEFKYNNLNINNLNLQFDHSKLLLNGNITDFLNLADSNSEGVKAYLTIDCDKLNLDNYLSVSSSTSSKSGYKFLLFPDLIKYDTYIKVKHLIYNKFQCENLKTHLIYNGSDISMKSISFNSANGKLDAYGKVFHKGNQQFIISGISHFSKMNIKQVFYQLNNFDQDYITDKHLSGSASGDVEFNMAFTYDFIPDFSSLFCMGDVLVEKGNLKDFQPIIDLFGFIKMKKLKDIYFDRFENTILIKDQLITIPYMEVRNSAFNIALSGTHSFNDDIDYLFRVNLTSLFLAQNKKTVADIINGEIDEKGGINTYIRMIGNVDDYKIIPEPFQSKKMMKENETKKKVEIQQMMKKKTPVTVNENYEFEWDEN